MTCVSARVALRLVTASELLSLAAGAVQAESSELPDPYRMILGHQLECHSATQPGLEPDNVGRANGAGRDQGWNRMEISCIIEMRKDLSYF